MLLLLLLLPIVTGLVNPSLIQCFSESAACTSIQVPRCGPPVCTVICDISNHSAVFACMAEGAPQCTTNCSGDTSNPLTQCPSCAVQCEPLRCASSPTCEIQCQPLDNCGYDIFPTPGVCDDTLTWTCETPFCPAPTAILSSSDAATTTTASVLLLLVVVLINVL